MTKNNSTAEGLRDILFNALNMVISKEISSKEVESICYVSEQIIKTAKVELETYQETAKEAENIRQHQLRMMREQQDSMRALENVIEVVEEMDNEGEE